MTSPNSGQISIIIISFRQLACKRIWKFQKYIYTHTHTIQYLSWRFSKQVQHNEIYSRYKSIE